MTQCPSKMGVENIYLASLGDPLAYDVCFYELHWTSNVLGVGGGAATDSLADSFLFWTPCRCPYRIARPDEVFLRGNHSQFHIDFTINSVSVNNNTQIEHIPL